MADVSCDENVTVCVSVDSFSQVFDFSRWSKFQKAINIVAWVRRFINNCKSPSSKFSGPLSYNEISQAKVEMFSCVQKEAYPREMFTLIQGKKLHKGSSLLKLDPFIDKEGLMRIKGRLENADMSFETKHPIILAYPVIFCQTFSSFPT